MPVPVTLATFDPRSIPSLIGWFDASDQSTITLSGNNTVSRWQNKASATTFTENLFFDFTQSTAGSQPSFVRNLQNGRNALTLSNTSQFMNGGVLGGLSQPFTFIAVYRVTDLTSSRGLQLLSDSNGVNLLVARSTSASGNERRMFLGVSLSAGARSGLYANWLIAHHVGNRANSSIARDMLPDITGDAGTNSLGTTFFLGGSVSIQRFAGHVGELLFYRSALPRESRELLVRWLARRWAIQL